jgi:hypothetical protein
MLRGCLFLFLMFPSSLFSCSSDYVIWMIRSADADPLYRFIKNGKAGFIDQTGKIVIPPILPYHGDNSTNEFHNGLLEIGVFKGIYVNTKGKIVIDGTNLERGFSFSEEMAIAMAKDGEFWGYIGRDGQFKIPPKFKNFEALEGDFSNGLAAVSIRDKIGYINKTGEFVIQPQYLEGFNFSEGRARVILEGPCKYSSDESCGPSDGGRVLPGGGRPPQNMQSCRFAFIDKTGRLITKQQFDNAKDFSEGLAAVAIGSQWGYLDQLGQIVIPPQYDLAFSFSDGLAKIKMGNFFGYIDKTGRIVIPPHFLEADHFADGLAPVSEKPNEFFYISKSGKQAFPERYLFATFYYRGLAHVKLLTSKADPSNPWNGKFAYIDKTGRRVFSYTIFDSDRLEKHSGGE